MTGNGVVETLSFLLMEGSDQPVELRPEGAERLRTLLRELPPLQRADAAEEVALFAQWLAEDKGSAGTRDEILAILREVLGN